MLIQFLYLINLFSKLLDTLFFFQRADKQLSILLGYDIAIQALNYHLAFIQADVLAYFGIAILILLKQGTEAAPAA